MFSKASKLLGLLWDFNSRLKFADESVWNLPRDFLEVIQIQLEQCEYNTKNELFLVRLHTPFLLPFKFRVEIISRYFEECKIKRRTLAPVIIEVRRTRELDDSLQTILKLNSDLIKRRFHIVYKGEEGLDAGGLFKEFFETVTKEIFDPN